MQIREVTLEEMKDVYYLSQQAFTHGRRDPNWQPSADAAQLTRYGVYDAAQLTRYGVYDENGLQQKVVVLNYRTHLGPDVVVPMGGVAGVSCLPASRGKGYTSACMDYSLERMRDAGQVISLLHPFSWAFYRKHGYEWVGEQREYKVLSRVLKSTPETEFVRAAKPADRSTLLAVYTEFAGRYRGMTLRADHAWNEILNDTDSEFTYTYLYERDGKAEGYLTLRGGKGDQTNIREFISLTPRAQKGLLGLLKRHDMQTEKFAWHAPNDDSFWLQQYNWDIETNLQPTAMGRVVDVAAALTAWKPAKNVQGAVRFAIEDEHCPWNTGTWQAEFADGVVSVIATGADPEVSLDIQAFTQAYFGTPTLEALRRADRLSVQSETGFGALTSLLAGPLMWLNDHLKAV